MADAPYEERTNAKLRFARVHLDELKSIHPLGGDDFDRAHQEAFLFQLLGARDCFWLELAARAGYPQKPNERVTGLRDRLRKQHSVKIKAIEVMHRFSQRKGSWLRLASDLRNIGTHDRGASRAYNLGGPLHQKVQLRDPKTGVLTGHFVDEFEDWHRKMSDLIARYRRNHRS